MDLLNISSYLSLVVQFLTGVYSIKGLTYELDKKDKILHSALKLETVVQLIEFIFYLYLVYNISNNTLPNNITSIRYIDWFITTPTMLVSTIIYLKYKEESLLGKSLDFFELLKSEKYNIIKILIGNWMMLLFGYLGEINVISIKYTTPIGFIFFAYVFKLLYSNYAVKSTDGLKLYWPMFIFWSLYGVAAVFDFENKNTSYNILDIFAKNFFGMFLYWLIKSKAINLEKN
jgi:bacteriorhodopsin